MALTTVQLEEILNYTAFQPYDTPQKETLRERLMQSRLEYLQIAVLFGDDASGGIIHNLVEDSQDSDVAAIQLGKIIENTSESISPDCGYGPTPIIQNLIGRLGSYNEAIANDVKELARQHVAIYNARVIVPTIDDPLPQRNDVAPGTSALFWFASDHVGRTMLARLLAEAQALPNLDLAALLASPNVAPQPLNAQERANAAYGVNQLYGFFGQEQQNLAQQARDAQLDLLNNRLAENPGDLNARLERAQLLGPNHAALDDYNYIIEREPNNVAALLARAAYHENGPDLDDNALADYRHVLEIEPQNELARAGIERLAPSAARPE